MKFNQSQALRHHFLNASVCLNTPHETDVGSENYPMVVQEINQGGIHQIPLEPFQITRYQLNYLLNSPSLVKEMLKSGEIEVVRLGKPGREALYDYQSVKTAYQRFKSSAKQATAVGRKSNHSGEVA